MVAGTPGKRATPAEERGSWAFLVPGLTYPLWPALAPEGSIDPLWAWLAVAACFFSVSASHMAGWISRARMLQSIPVLASLVVLHFFVLATVNAMEPFYAVGSTMAGLAPVLFIRSRRAMIGYSLFVGSLSIALYGIQPDAAKLAYWGALIPVLGLGYYQVAREASNWHALEGVIADRTRELSEANRSLRGEVEERTRLEHELRVQHKMEAIGRLAGGIAHDFNNVLSTIGVYADLLERGLPPDGPLRVEVDHIQQATQQAASLTQQLLTVGRRSHVRIVGVDLNEIVSDAASMVGHLAGADVEVVYEHCEEPLPILANPDQLQQILINLVTNARDAMPTGGCITIGTSARCAERPTEPGGASEQPAKDYVCLTVRDTGKGMSAGTAERIFDPFFTTKAPGRGIGLGLASVHGIVSQARGFVRVESEPGEGSTFVLCWPRDARRVDERADREIEPLPSLSGTERILLVEDDHSLRQGLALVLRSSGYAVTEAVSGEQALQFIPRYPNHFDLLVSDVVMGEISGFELARRVVEFSPITKVLLISAHLSEESLKDDDEGFPLLAKPFGGQLFLENVRRVLSGSVDA